MYFIMMSSRVVVTMVLNLLGVEGEGSEQVLALPAVPPQLASAHGCAEEAQGQCNLEMQMKTRFALVFVCERNNK